MQYSFNVDLLERLCVYGEAILPGTVECQSLINYKLIEPGREIADLSKGQTQLVTMWRISSRGIKFCQTNENNRPQLIEFWRKLDE